MFKKGFTLIELLVVIAIIAILAAILFPVFAQAREKARQASCLSNVKQLGTATQLYIDDYDETLPFRMKFDGWPGSEWDTYPKCNLGPAQDPWLGGISPAATTWMDCIFPYVKNMQIYVCPSFRKTVKWNFWAKNLLVPGYGYNAELMPSGSTYESCSAAQVVPGIALAELKSTAETVFICDTGSENGNMEGITTWSKGAVYPGFIDVTLIGATSWNSGLRHISGANFCMADGHAKYFKKNQGPLDCSGYADTGNGAKYWKYRLQ